MNESTAVGVDRTELVMALRRDAAGVWRRMAAVELLAEHGHWLGREVLLTCIAYYPADTQGPAVAVPNWAAVGALLDHAGVPDTDSQRCVLGVAASLTSGHRVNLREVAFCDWSTVELIAQAIRTAGGGR